MLMKLSIVGIFVVFLLHNSSSSSLLSKSLKPLVPSDSYTHILDVDEDQPNHYLLLWKYDENEIQFEIHCKTKGWVGFGLSPNGGMKSADIAIGWVDKSGKGQLKDCHATGTTTPQMDTQQDLTLLDAAQIDDYTILKFKRKLATCDQNDREIKGGTYKLIFAWNDEDPVTGNNDWKYHNENRLTRTMILMSFKEQDIEQQEVLPSDTFTFDIKMPNVTIANKDTYYFCELFELPKFDKDVHLIQFEMIFGEQSKKFVHHLIGFECEEGFEPSQSLGRECGAAPIPQEFGVKCMSRMSFAWAVGGVKKYSFPPQAGYLIKPSVKPRYMLLEMHYDNPRLLSNVVDNTGVRLYFTPTLRKYDLGLMQLGSTQLQIPPYSEISRYSSICYPECTQEFFPDNGIYVVTGLLHTHLAGTSVKTTLVRNNVEIANIFNNPTYDFEYQNAIEIEPLKLMKGDALMTECTYNTKNRSAFTTWGFGTHDEMCINYVYYYPKISNFASCFTNMPTQELMKFYRNLIKDGLTPGLVISDDDNSYWPSAQYIENYFKTKANFTPALTKRFEEFYGSKVQNRTLYCGNFAEPDSQVYKENIKDFVPTKYYVEPDLCNGSYKIKSLTILLLSFAGFFINYF